MSFALLLAKNVHLSSDEEFCSIPCQKIRTSVSPFLNGAEFTLSVAKNVALFENVRILRTVKWRDWQRIEAAKQTMEFPAAPFFLVEISKKWIQNYWKLKKRLCVRLLLGNKHHLRKSADRKAQIRKAFVPLTELCVVFGIKAGPPLDLSFWSFLTFFAPWYRRSWEASSVKIL